LCASLTSSNFDFRITVSFFILIYFGWLILVIVDASLQNRLLFLTALLVQILFFYFFVLGKFLF
jgi:hypothetical protein